MTEEVMESGGHRPRLTGNMGVGALVFTVLAFNAPLTTISGGMPVVFAYGNGIGAPLAYLTIGAIVLLFSVGLNAMSSHMRQPGAFYCYVTEGLGRPAGLGAGFLAVFCYVALGAGSYAFSAVLFNHFLTGALGLEPGPWWAWALIFWFLCTSLSLFNIDASAKVLGVALVFEMLIVTAWNGCVLWEGGPSGHFPNPLPGALTGSPVMALVFAGMCLVGFESIQVFRDETRDPERTVPRATYLSVIIITACYVISAYSFLVAYGLERVVPAASLDPAGSVMDSFRTYLGSVATKCAMLLMLTSANAATLAIQNVNARYLYALGKDEVLPKLLGSVSRRHGSPAYAALVSGLVIAATFLVPTLAGADQVAAYVALLGIGSVAMLILWATTCVAVIAFFRRRNVESDRWSTQTAPSLALIGLMTLLVFILRDPSNIMGGHDAAEVALATMCAAVGAGVVTALYWRVTDQRVYQSIGGGHQAVEP